MARGAWRAIVHGVSKSQTVSFFFPWPEEKEAGSRGPEGQDTHETRTQGHLRQGSYKVLAKSVHSREDRRVFTPRDSVPLPPSAPVTENEVSLCPALPAGQGGALPIRPDT